MVDLCEFAEMIKYPFDGEVLVRTISVNNTNFV
jgi:hypothetical protein